MSSLDPLYDEVSLLHQEYQIKIKVELGLGSGLTSVLSNKIIANLAIQSCFQKALLILINNTKFCI